MLMLQLLPFLLYLHPGRSSSIWKIWQSNVKGTEGKAKQAVKITWERWRNSEETKQTCVTGKVKLPKSPRHGCGWAHCPRNTNSCISKLMDDFVSHVKANGSLHSNHNGTVTACFPGTTNLFHSWPCPLYCDKTTCPTSFQCTTANPNISSLRNLWKGHVLQ
jgi:hypothetical protein